MASDILERAKAADPEMLAVLDWGALRDLISELIAEVKRLRSTPKSGLYGKYIIQKADGSPVDPKADYFILRLDTDPIARRAALEYSYFMASGKDIQLAKDLQARVAKYDPKSEDAVYLRYIGVQKNEVLEQLESTKAEVERLRSENNRINKLREAEINQAGAAERVYLEAMMVKDARIKELEAERELFVSPGSTLEAALLWIKAQEAWLVEERANLILEQIRGGSIITLQDPDERRANAIRQLQAEGKIGGGKTEYGGQHHCGTQIIRTGGGEWHCPKCNPLLTAEQRDALEYVIEALHHTHCPECETLLMRADQEPAISAIRDLLSGSVPAWEATDERIQAIRRCMSMTADFFDLSVIKAMLEEGKRDA